MFNDLREFIEMAQSYNLVKVINGADWDLEMGVITELFQSKPDQPLLMFDNIRNYPEGYRTVTNCLNNFQLIAMAYGLPVHLKGTDLITAFRQRLEDNFSLIPPVEVSSGSIEENVLLGKDIDLWKFPAAKWHEHDGGRYIGTGTAVITKDPDTGNINLGAMRVQVHEKDIANVHIEHTRNTHYIRKKYWDKGLSCPVAVVCGSDPRLLVAAGSTVVPGIGKEYDFAGWLKGAPIEVIKGKTVDLPIPASAEIVIEGELLPPGIDDRIEGPFGEGKGYYDGGQLEPVMKVSCILHRDNPILLGCPPLTGRFELRYGLHVQRAAIIWQELEKYISGVEGVWLMNETRNPTLVISIKQQSGSHAKQAAITALGCCTTKRVQFMPRFIIIVDDDIDPSKINEVLLALGTRCNPEEGIDVIKGLPVSGNDMLVTPEKRSIGDISLGKCIINACKPYHRLNEIPLINKCNPTLLENIADKWKLF